MNLRLEATPAPLSAQAPANAPATANGQLNGKTVQVLTAPSVLGAAAEEISLHLGSKVDSKTYAERRVRPRAQPQHLSPEQVHHYLQKVGKVAWLDEVVRESREWTRPGDLARFADPSTGDPSADPAERYLLLMHARRAAQADGASPERLAWFDAALTDLHDRAGGVIEARLATIDHAAGYAQSVPEIRQFQAAVDTLLDQPTLSQALQEVLRLAGRTGERLDTAVSGLLKALGSCLGLPGAACDKPLLQTLVTDLYHLKSLNTVLSDCKALVRRLKHCLDPVLSAPEPQDARSG